MTITQRDYFACSFPNRNWDATQRQPALQWDFKPPNLNRQYLASIRRFGGGGLKAELQHSEPMIIV